MNRNLMNHNFSSASLRGPKSARTVLLRMAADQERADRIRALKLARPDLTWRRIADHVGVSERAAADWQRKGGIEHANAKKLAALFEVDVDYIWRGTGSDTPTPFAGPDDQADLLERVEQLLLQQNELLARQSRILERIEAATRRVDEASHDLARASAEAGQALTAGTGRPRRAAKAPVRTPKPRA